MSRIVLLMLVTGILVTVSAFGAEPFDIGFDDRIDFAPFFLAAEKGFYHGVTVRLNRVTKEEQRRSDLASGRLQMICETMGMFQTGRNNLDYDGKLIFALDEFQGTDGVLAANGINSVGDLKGKTEPFRIINMLCCRCKSDVRHWTFGQR